MSAIYGSATVCPFGEKNCAEKATNRLTLDPDIAERFDKSRNFDELKYLWTEWRNQTGPLMRDNYEIYVNLMNRVATENGFKNAAELWQDEFEVDNFEEIIDKLWLQVKPLYDDLHTYMRYQLISIYGEKINRSDENIPAHLLGNMWAQSWAALYIDTKPFQSNDAHDVTSTMKAKQYTPLKMFEVANEFYMSLGLPSNEMSYKTPSVIEKPNDRNIICHASAWDFFGSTDFRIKMCTSVNEENLIVIHHEMGTYIQKSVYCQYYLFALCKLKFYMSH